MKYPYFVDISIITHMLSEVFFVIGSVDGGNFTIKSNAILCHAPSGDSMGSSFLYDFFLVAFALLHMSHSHMTLKTSCLIPGKKYFLAILLIVLLISGCLTNGFLWIC